MFVNPRACEMAGNPPLRITISALAWDAVLYMYLLGVFIIPMMKTIAVLEGISGGKPNIRLNLWINKVMIYSSITVVTNWLISILVPVLNITTHGVRDRNAVQLLHNGSLLVASYCVVVQFDVDIDSVKNKWIKRMLTCFDCNNCAARYCEKFCSGRRTRRTGTAEGEMANSVDSEPESNGSIDNGTVEIQTMG